jgi:hypothetical protein
MAKSELKPVAKGRDKDVVSYLVEEHVAVLKIMLSQTNAFNASESSEDILFYFYILYFIFCFISTGARTTIPKCPMSYNNAADNEICEYIESLFGF